MCSKDKDEVPGWIKGLLRKLKATTACLIEGCQTFSSTRLDPDGLAIETRLGSGWGRKL